MRSKFVLTYLSSLFSMLFYFNEHCDIVPELFFSNIKIVILKEMSLRPVKVSTLCSVFTPVQMQYFLLNVNNLDNILSPDHSTLVSLSGHNYFFKDPDRGTT